MINASFPRKLFLLASVILCGLAPACAPNSSTEFSENALRADLQEWRDWFFSTHPDPTFSADIAVLEARFDFLAEQLEGTHSRREAWLEFSVLNPLFNDGHVTIRAPQADYEAYLAQGGATFNVPVAFQDGRLFVADSIASQSPLTAGDEILMINSVPADQLTGEIMIRLNGDTDGLRAHLLETRFSLYLWAVTGGSTHWEIVVSDTSGTRRSVQLDEQRDHGNADTDLWRVSFVENAAVLTVNTFMPEHETAFVAFLESAFADIASNGSESLIIDISQNGGGAHQLSDRLLAYITTRRYTPLSAVTARITAENQALIPGSEIGQVLSMPFAQWVEPPAELENRFSGNVAILVGSGTYSQAIVMAATAQDFDIAPVAGPGTEGRANSTGQVQLHRLSNSDLEVAAPIYIFIRPSGDTSDAPVEPDIPLEGTHADQLNRLIGILRTD
jgi:C-terminal processing protease CtpA/Prc